MYDIMNIINFIIPTKLAFEVFNKTYRIRTIGLISILSDIRYTTLGLGVWVNTEHFNLTNPSLQRVIS